MNFDHIGIGSFFFYVTPKAQANKKQYKNKTLSKLKPLCFKKHYKKLKRAHTVEEYIKNS